MERTEKKRWWKVDFHTHSPASKDTHMTGVDESDWLLAFMHGKVDAVAITDHNTGAFVDTLKTAYSLMKREEGPGFRPLVLYPGVEITTAENIHLLAIFNPHCTSGTIELFLNETGCPSSSRGEASCMAHSKMEQVFSLIDTYGGIAIPAHIDRERGRGMLSLNPDQVSDLVLTGKIQVVESSGSITEWPYPYQGNPSNWTVIVGSDTHTLDDDDPISRTPGSVYTRILSDNLNFNTIRNIFQSGNCWIIREDTSTP